MQTGIRLGLKYGHITQPYVPAIQQMDFNFTPAFAWTQQNLKLLETYMNDPHTHERFQSQQQNQITT